MIVSSTTIQGENQRLSCVTDSPYCIQSDLVQKFPNINTMKKSSKPKNIVKLSVMSID